MWRPVTAIVLALVVSGCAATTVSNVKPLSMAQGHYDRGISYFQVKDYEGALVEFQRAMQADSHFKMPYYATGVVYDLMGKYGDAEKYYEEAIDIDSDFSEAHNALGVVYYKQKRWKDALKQFKKALENKLYPTPHIVYINMGDMFMAQKEYAKALEAYRESKRLVNEDIVVYKIGMALIALGKSREAVGELQEGTALAPKNIEMRLALGIALLKNGDQGAALSEFQRVVELAPKSDTARTAQDYISTLTRKQPRKRGAR